jgi:4-alpha-glucanotransferase
MSMIFRNLIFLLLISISFCLRSKRRAGILMHISSLPSKYGIGTLGEEAYRFIDFLRNAKQRIWEMLPIGPTLFGDSPYQSPSTFAGNPYFIDLDFLINENLLTEGEVKSLNWGENDPTKVDYSIMFNQRFDVLYKAFQRFRPLNEYYLFINMNKEWVEDYAFFMALKKHFNYKSWVEWPEDLKLHKSEALKEYRISLQYEIRFFLFLEFKFQEQLKRLKDYASFKHIQLIGDIPFYPPLDSADVWANQKLFQIDEHGNLLAKAGVPPDSFNSEGQIWGNPLYNWEKMKEDNYQWWIKRIMVASQRFSIVRIDHFIGLESYWSIPPNENDARMGKWIKGPDRDFIHVLHKLVPFVDFIAGDLGYLSPEVKQLLEYSKYPGTKVLQYAFDSREPGNYFPHTYIPNSVCYTGMHDHNTLAGWEQEISIEDRKLAEEYLGLEPGEDLVWPIIRAGLASVSKVFIAPMQDYLELGSEARMNRPGINDGNNWRWRCKKEYINNDLAWKLQELSEMYGRYDLS